MAPEPGLRRPGAQAIAGRQDRLEAEAQLQRQAGWSEAYRSTARRQAGGQEARLDGFQFVTQSRFRVS